MNILVAGGTGFVGRHLVPALLLEGHNVRIMTRHPGSRSDGATEVMGDVAEPLSIAAAMVDIDAAYYLVHTLDRDDFVERDRIGATNFSEQAAASGLQRVVYLGGLGDDDDDLSEHLRSRREVEQILGAHVPTVTLRAGIVVGDGSVSWEILCQLVERLPVMITPRWVQTKTQPIALDDIVTYLVGALDLETGEYYEIGAPESMTYREMLKGAADEMDRTLYVVPVPILTPKLSSHWLRLITDVDLQTARSLVDSMANEVVVTDRRIERITGHQPIPFREAARIALQQRADRKRRENADDEPADASR